MTTTTIISKQEQAEQLIVTMDSIQHELEQAESRKLFESCKTDLAALKVEIEALGYQVERCVTGWRLVLPVVEEAKATQATSTVEPQLEQKYVETGARTATMMGRHMAVRQYTKLYTLTGVLSFFSPSELEMNAKLSAQTEAHENRIPQEQYPAWEKLFTEQYSAAYRQKVTEWKDKQEAKRLAREVAQAASIPTAQLKEDEQGLYAEVPSSTGKTSYRVGVCAKWLKSVSCTCKAGQFGKDCPHQVQTDEQLRDIRPTFSQWIAGEGVSRETINALLAPDRYAKPLKGSGVTGFRAAEIAQKLAA